ncbi:hypothetical protein SDC9_79839 [bioreactor metagenome]|uniref:Uncharacterized protein n=1 Tax=bioreactor metagenome TaxID=1076179 RepID=A0A644YY86_9ZZZZ
MDKPPVGIVGKPGIIRQLGDSLNSRIPHAEIQNGVHHAGHGGSGPRAHRDKQRVYGIAELFTGDPLRNLQMLKNLLLNLRSNNLAVLVIFQAGLGCNGEPLRNRHAEVRHFGQVCPFSAQQLPHSAISLRKKVDIFLSHLHSSCYIGSVNYNF